VPYNPPVKGILPVPRNVFAGTSKDLASDKQIALSTKPPAHLKAPPKGSRAEWKVKMSELRRQNLRDGLKGLKSRQQSESARISKQSDARQAERQERLNRPEREDERLTAPSNNIDLEALFGKAPPDPTREERLERKRLNIEAAALRKQEARMDAIHSLYLNARDFILTPEQLDKAVEDVFGTAENPVNFAPSASQHDASASRFSIWAEGRPERISDMVNLASGTSTSRAVDNVSSFSEINKERIRRIAETLTGGKMDKSERQ
jgi:hypothetical protein